MSQAAIPRIHEEQEQSNAGTTLWVSRANVDDSSGGIWSAATDRARQSSNRTAGVRATELCRVRRRDTSRNTVGASVRPHPDQRLWLCSRLDRDLAAQLRRVFAGAQSDCRGD